MLRGFEKVTSDHVQMQNNGHSVEVEMMGELPEVYFLDLSKNGYARVTSSV